MCPWLAGSAAGEADVEGKGGASLPSGSTSTPSVAEFAQLRTYRIESRQRSLTHRRRASGGAERAVPAWEVSNSRMRILWKTWNHSP